METQNFDEWFKDLLKYAQESESPGLIDAHDPDAYKEYFDDGKWQHKKIILSPDNRKFKDIVLEKVSGEDFRVVAEFVEVVSS